jgi:hypothetical protein
VNEELIGDPRERGAHHGCELRSLNLPPMGKRWGRGGEGRGWARRKGFLWFWGGFSVGVCIPSPFGEFFCLFFADDDDEAATKSRI